MAVAYASQKEPAKLEEVIGTADGINHAIPSQWELQRTLGRLQHNELVAKVNRRYSLTDAGRELMDEASSKHTKMFDVLKELSLHLPDGGEIHKDEDVTQDEVQNGYKSYKKRFWQRHRELKNKG